LLLAPEARACDFNSNHVLEGLLVADQFNPPALPRNLAFLTRADEARPDGTTLVGQTSLGEPIAASPIEGVSAPAGLSIVRVNEPVEPNASVFVGVDLTVGTEIDETPPEQPIIAGGAVTFNSGRQVCAQDSCGDYTELEVTIEPVADDHAASAHMVYAVYLARGASEAATTSTPLAVLRHGQPLWMLISDEWADSDAYVAISALDHAGNESPRSAPYRVNAAESGCTIRRRHRSSSVTPGLLLLLMTLGAFRRRS
jgi:hypothetical protein